MIADGGLHLDCVTVDADRWYEVDALGDLPGAERIAKQKSTPAMPSLLMQIQAEAGRA